MHYRKLPSGTALSSVELEFFEREGFLGPFPLFEPTEVDAATKRLRKSFFPGRFRRLLRFFIELIRPRDYVRWQKGSHAEVKQICDLAADPLILDRVESVIGRNILIWGSVMIDKMPGDDHGWHGDVEHVEWEGISAWIGLAGVTPLSSISVITRSHRFNTYPQKIAIDIGLDQHSDEAVLDVARAIDPECQLMHLNVRAGEFILFAGRTWHEARHRSTGVRSSIVFQYSPPTSKVRMPLSYAPPVKWHETPPPCCILRGSDSVKINKIVQRP